MTNDHNADLEAREASSASETPDVLPQPPTNKLRKLGALVPGVVVCLVAAVISWLGAQVIGMSALLIAILLGAVWRNIAPVPTAMSEGVAFSSKKLLRTGIVLLGLQLSLSSILDLGFGVLAVVLVSVTVTFFGTLWAGHLMGISFAQRVLIACGFSICGAAAVAAAEGTTDAKEEEVATAIALVVLFGTLMIPLVPTLGSLLGMPDEMAGMWIGASTHEVAQVVAAGGTVSGAALAVAVTVKLARVITLAPIIAGIAVFMRRRGTQPGAAKPPIVPLFVAGFIVAMLIRTAGFLPQDFLSAMEIAQTILLAAAMFALGLGVHIRSLFKVGAKPVVLGVISTSIILVVSLGGSLLFG